MTSHLGEMNPLPWKGFFYVVNSDIFYCFVWFHIDFIHNSSENHGMNLTKITFTLNDYSTTTDRYGLFYKSEFFRPMILMVVIFTVFLKWIEFWKSLLFS